MRRNLCSFWQAARPRQAARAALLLVSLASAPAGVHAQQMDADMPMSMEGLLGRYSMTREGSGTSWQPESTPADGAHQMSGAWMTMEHGYVDVIYDEQGGPRGPWRTAPHAGVRGAP
jgi:hypothetical protein